MKRNSDVMRSDRLKQVMQEIDSSFDEKNLGISKFSRFCQEAAQRGLLSVTKLDNGQLEVDLPGALPATEGQVARAEASPLNGEAAPSPAAGGEDRSRRGRRGRGGRGRDRTDRESRGPRPPQGGEVHDAAARPDQVVPSESSNEPAVMPAAALAPTPALAHVPEPPRAGAVEAVTSPAGERLTRAEAFDLVKRTIDDLAPGDESIRASHARERARQLLGRDSESLSERMFVRILKDAHDAGIVDLRRRGDDFEVARAASAASVSDQLARHEQAATAATAGAAAAAAPAGPRLGMGHRGAGPRAGRAAPPPGLLSIGVVEHEPAPPAAHHAPSRAAKPEQSEAKLPETVTAHAAETTEPSAPAKRGRQVRAGKAAAKGKRPPAAKKQSGPPRSRGKRAAAPET
jgi:hypothetical protein